MACKFREGNKHCIWFVSGCINPQAPPEIKRQCDGQLPKYKTEGIKEVVRV